MDGDGALGYFDQAKGALDFIRTAIRTARDAKDLIDDVDQKEVIEQKLGEAERSAQLAEAQIAKGLGYEICRCDYPPKIMKVIGRYPGTDIQQIACPACGDKKPTDRHCQAHAELNRRSAVERGPHSWMGV